MNKMSRLFYEAITQPLELIKANRNNTRKEINEVKNTQIQTKKCHLKAYA